MEYQIRRAKRKERSVQKSIIPGIVLTGLCWLGLFSLIWYVDPVIVADFIVPQGYILFFGLVFVALILTFRMLIPSRRVGLMVTILIEFYLVLQLLGLQGGFNATLLGLLMMAIELYLRKAKS